MCEVQYYLLKFKKFRCAQWKHTHAVKVWMGVINTKVREVVNFEREEDD